MQDARGWLEVFVEGLKCLLNILLKSVDSSSSRFAIILHLSVGCAALIRPTGLGVEPGG
jgi:hypothetical protein